MLNIKEYTPLTGIPEKERKTLVEFLDEHLERPGDPEYEIESSIRLAMERKDPSGGFVVLGYYAGELAGALVVSRATGNDYTHENARVLIAVKPRHKGKGLGRKLLRRVEGLSGEDIEINVERFDPEGFLRDKMQTVTRFLEERKGRTLND